MNNPKVSVILPTYNAAQYLEKAIQSILSQSFTDFELIIVDDGSHDQTPEVLTKQTDPRIIIIRQENLGLPKALNRGIKSARGEYLARQDADDISLPSRLEKQVAFLDQNSQYALVGSWAKIMTPQGATHRALLHPCSNGQLQVQLFFNNQFVHSSIMIRSAALDSTGIYSEDPEHFPPEDYDLWLRIANQYCVANIPEILLEYLEVPNSISRTKENLIRDRATKMSLKAIQMIPTIHHGFGTLITLIDIANGRSAKLSFKEFLNLLDLTNKIKKYTALRFPNEKSNILKGINFIRKQIAKAMLKKLIL